MILLTPKTQNPAVVAPPTKTQIRTLSDHETKVVAAGTAVISSADLGGAQPDGGAKGLRADRIYRK
jgi:hypothetical protein